MATWNSETENINPEFEIQSYQLKLFFRYPKDKNTKIPVFSIGGKRIEESYSCTNLSPSLLASLDRFQKDFISKIWLNPDDSDKQRKSLSDTSSGAKKKLHIFKTRKLFESYCKANKITKFVGEYKTLGTDETGSNVCLLVSSQTLERGDAERNKLLEVEPKLQLKSATNMRLISKNQAPKRHTVFRTGTERTTSQVDQERQLLQLQPHQHQSGQASETFLILNKQEQPEKEEETTIQREDKKEEKEIFEPPSRILPKKEFQRPFFRGRIQITGIIKKETDRLTLNTLHLNISEAKWFWPKTNKFLDINRIEINESFETATFYLPVGTLLKEGDKGTLVVSYEGKLYHGDESGGNGAYFHEGVLCTQFEPTHARRVFPCHDAPWAKAKFQLTVCTEGHVGTCVSNAPLRAYSISFPSGLQEWDFDSIFPLSSYLVAIVLGTEGLFEASEMFYVLPKINDILVPNLPPSFLEQKSGQESTKRSAETSDDNPRSILLRCLAPKFPTTKKARENVLQTLAAIMEYSFWYLKCPYWWAKLDAICVNKLRPVAMENAGVMVFRCADVLYPISETGVSPPWALSSATPQRKPKKRTQEERQRKESFQVTSEPEPQVVIQPSLEEEQKFLHEYQEKIVVQVPFVGPSEVTWDVNSFFKNVQQKKVSPHEEEKEHGKETVGQENKNKKKVHNSYRVLKSKLSKLWLSEFNIKQRVKVAKLIAHEYAHQYFGNNVTCQGWEHLFWNEAFATFFSFDFLDAIYPSWKIWSHFLSQDYWRALSAELPFFVHEEDKTKDPSEIEQLDASLFLHPVAPDAKWLKNRKNGVESVFDFITYSKGACLLRMTQQMVGEFAWRNALIRIFSKEAGKTMTFQYFVQIVEEEYQKKKKVSPETIPKWTQVPAGDEIPGVTQILTSWFTRIGFPQLFVSPSSENQHLQVVIRQQQGIVKRNSSFRILSGQPQEFNPSATSFFELFSRLTETTRKDQQEGQNKLWSVPLMIQMNSFSPEPLHSNFGSNPPTNSLSKLLLFSPFPLLAQQQKKEEQERKQKILSVMESFEVKMPKQTFLTGEQVKINMLIMPNRDDKKTHHSATPTETYTSPAFCSSGGTCGILPTMMKLNSKGFGYYVTHYQACILRKYLFSSLQFLDEEDRIQLHQDVYLSFRLGVINQQDYLDFLQQFRKETNIRVLKSILQRLKVLMVASFETSVKVAEDEGFKVEDSGKLSKSKTKKKLLLFMKVVETAYLWVHQALHLMQAAVAQINLYGFFAWLMIRPLHDCSTYFQEQAYHLTKNEDLKETVYHLQILSHYFLFFQFQAATCKKTIREIESHLREQEQKEEREKERQKEIRRREIAHQEFLKEQETPTQIIVVALSPRLQQENTSNTRKESKKTSPPATDLPSSSLVTEFIEKENSKKETEETLPLTYVPSSPKKETEEEDERLKKPEKKTKNTNEEKYESGKELYQKLQKQRDKLEAADQKKKMEASNSPKTLTARDIDEEEKDQRPEIKSSQDVEQNTNGNFVLSFPKQSKTTLKGERARTREKVVSSKKKTEEPEKEENSNADSSKSTFVSLVSLPSKKNSESVNFADTTMEDEQKKAETKIQEETEAEQNPASSVLNLDSTTGSVDEEEEEDFLVLPSASSPLFIGVSADVLAPKKEEKEEDFKTMEERSPSSVDVSSLIRSLQSSFLGSKKTSTKSRLLEEVMNKIQTFSNSSLKRFSVSALHEDEKEFSASLGREKSSVSSSLFSPTLQSAIDTYNWQERFDWEKSNLGLNVAF